MISSDEIQSRQNGEKLLKIQYTAREYYNFAENLNHFAWLLCLLSAFSIFLPDNCPEIISYGIPFAADIAAFFLVLLVNHKVKTAANLRSYFDSYVLDISTNQFTKIEIRKLREIAKKEYSKNPQKAVVQISNTGKDSPPGVHEWYVFAEPCIGIMAQFECQRQNSWWNSKMLRKRLVATICTFVIIVIAFLLLLDNSDVIVVFLCSAGIIGRIVERLIENCKYIYLSVLIDGAQQNIEAHPTNEGINHLQTLIDKRRGINVLELNWFHKKNANRLSKLYEDSIT